MSIFRYNKATVSAAGAIITTAIVGLTQAFTTLPLDQATGIGGALGAVITFALTYLVPNVPAPPAKPDEVKP